jgi:hypothetical protein
MALAWVKGLRPEYVPTWADYYVLGKSLGSQ